MNIVPLLHANSGDEVYRHDNVHDPIVFDSDNDYHVGLLERGLLFVDPVVAGVYACYLNLLKSDGEDINKLCVGYIDVNVRDIVYGTDPVACDYRVPCTTWVRKEPSKEYFTEVKFFTCDILEENVTHFLVNRFLGS